MSDGGSDPFLNQFDYFEDLLGQTFAWVGSFNCPSNFIYTRSTVRSYMGVMSAKAGKVVGKYTIQLKQCFQVEHQKTAAVEKKLTGGRPTYLQNSASVLINSH